MYFELWHDAHSFNTANFYMAWQLPGDEMAKRPPARHHVVIVFYIICLITRIINRGPSSSLGRRVAAVPCH